jgi:serine/threonine-protein kinase HipA
MNPNAQGAGLRLNISETDNAQDLELALSVASVFRLSRARAGEITAEVMEAVRQWRTVASSHGLARSAQDRMRRAFRVADR